MKHVGKIVPLALSLALGLSCVGGVGMAEEQQKELPSYFHKYDPPITLTTHAVVTTSNVFQEGDSADSNGYTRWCEENLGIKWELAWTAGDAETNSQKLDLAFASDDLPDVIAPSVAQLSKYVDSGKIAPMDDLLEQYASPLTQWAIDDVTEQTAGAFFSPVTSGGHAYALPEMSDTLAWWTNNFIRTDILEELGMEMPTTLDELEAIFDAYIEKYPGHYPAVCSNALQDSANLFNTVMTSYNAYMDMWQENEEGQLEYTSIQPEMRAALERMATWYEKGYIDPEFVVMDGNKYNEVISSGDWLFTYGYWHLIATFCNTWANVEGSDISAVPFLNGPDGNYSVMKNAWYTSLKAITTSCENPEAPIYLLNQFWDSYYRNDTELRDELAQEGYEWYYPVTEVQEAYNIEEVKQNYPNVAEPKLLWKFNYDESITGPGFLNDFYTHGNINLGLYGRLCTPANNDYASISAAVKAGNDTSLLTEEAKNTWTGWYDSDPKMLSTFATSYDIWKDLDIEVNKFSTASTPTMVEKQAYLDKLELEYFTGIIMGTRPIEDFDKYVEEWKANGGDQITAEVNEWYASTK